MSKITTRSRFYYGAEITSESKCIDFSEGGLELQATLTIGDYTMLALAEEMARAMSEVGNLTYVGTFNRTTREITITASGVFSLLSASGSRLGTTACLILGFSILTDHTGASTYVGTNKAASEYQTQYPVTSYVAENDSLVKMAATVNVSATGVTQQMFYADGATLEMNIRLITNKTGLQNVSFLENVNGVANFKTFMTKIMQKGQLEFMPDVGDVNTFTKVILNSTAEDSSGLKYKLKNMKTPEFYESGILTFRKVIE